MKCKICEMNPDKPMELVARYDDPHPGADGRVYAYNLFQCLYCGAICENDIWHNSGETWITAEKTRRGLRA